MSSCEFKWTESRAIMRDQIALVILDLSNFALQAPVILGTPMISHIINVIKEKEIDVLAKPWVNAWAAYLLAVPWATATIEDSKPGESDPSEYDEIVTTKDTRTIDAFLSHVIHVKRRGDQCDDSGSTC